MIQMVKNTEDAEVCSLKGGLRRNKKAAASMHGVFTRPAEYLKGEGWFRKPSGTQKNNLKGAEKKMRGSRRSGFETGKKKGRKPNGGNVK